MDKNQIKNDLIEKSNSILTKYSEPDIVEDISVMNMSSKTVFLGSLKIYNTDVVNKVIKDLNRQMDGYGEITIRNQRVNPCCAPGYVHISFNIIIRN